MIERAVGLSPERASAIASCPCVSRASSFIQHFRPMSNAHWIAAAASPCGGASAVKKLLA